MDKKPSLSILALMISAGSALSGAAYADNMSGSITVTGDPTTGSTPSAQSGSGQSFTLTNNQNLYTSLSPPYSGSLTASVPNGIMSLQAVTASPITGISGNTVDQLTYTTTFTNTGGASQAFAFNYYIGSSTLIADPVFNFASPAGSVYAGVNAAISVNGTQAWSSNANLTGSATGPYTGESFNLVTSRPASSYTITPIQGNLGELVSFGALSGAVPLGVLAPGQVVQITYTLTGTTSTTETSNSLAFYGGSLAQIGDPFSVKGQGITTFGVSPLGAVSAVPETSTTVMAAAGLAMLAAMTRRRKLARIA
jgi:hypothetical protein